MLDEKKVALMTKMALYEQGEGKKSLPMSKYYRSDYLSLRLINSTIVVTIAYAMIIGLGILVNFEQILEELVSLDLLKIGKHMLISYIAVVAVNAVMTYFIYGHRFKKYRKGLNEYNGNLKKLYAVSRQKEKQKDSAGGWKDEESTGD